MKKLSLNEYKRIRLNDIHELEKDIASSKELKFVLNQKWFKRVRKVVNDFNDQLSFNDGAYDLFRILSYEFQAESLEERLTTIEVLAQKQSRLRSYRKTRNELASTQTNQIFGSLFEVNILSGIIKSCASTDLFPKTGTGGSDVEAKIIIDTREIFIEAKAFGYSGYDSVSPYSGYVGVHSVDCMLQQIYKGLNAKLAKGQQLYELSNKGPTVLLLSLGFNADIHSCSWAIESYYEESQSNVSLILVFGSALCRGEMRAFPNNYSSFPLSETEHLYFRKELYKKLAIDWIA